MIKGRTQRETVLSETVHSPVAFLDREQTEFVMNVQDLLCNDFAEDLVRRLLERDGAKVCRPGCTVLLQNQDRR